LGRASTESTAIVFVAVDVDANEPSFALLFEPRLGPNSEERAAAAWSCADASFRQSGAHGREERDYDDDDGG
jgi:hypothetical protein